MKKIYMLLAAVLLMLMAGCGGGDDSKAPPSTAKAITAFYLSGVVGTIDEPGKTIAVTMPYGTDVTSLVAMFRTTGASVQVDTTVQESEATSNDFSSPVDYTVTAEDGSSVIYTVTVTAISTPKPRAFTSFSLTGNTETVDGIINETGKKISVRMDGDLKNLVATFTTAAGATVTVGSTPQTSGVTANDFTKPVVYTVTNDGSSANYTVKINDYVETHMENDLGKDTIIDSINYYSYYADGRKAKEQIDDAGNKKPIDAVYIYGYDEKWNMTKREYDIDNDGTIDFVDYYEYDENDNIKKWKFDSLNDGIIDFVVEYTYEDGNKTYEIEYNKDGTINKIYHYTYENGYMTKVDIDDIHDDTYDSAITYTYENGYMTDEIEYNNIGKKRKAYHYTYENGYITKVDIDSNGDGTYDSVITYTYENGNMKTKVSDRGIYTYYWALIEAP